MMLATMVDVNCRHCCMRLWAMIGEGVGTRRRLVWSVVHLDHGGAEIVSVVGGVFLCLCQFGFGVKIESGK